MNGDGKIDLISANSSDGYTNGNTLTVLTNNGTGGYVFSSSPVVGAAPYSVAAADVNGDGWVDLISANNGTNTLSVLTNNRSGGFVLAATITVGNNPISVTAADVNGDGKVDLISANEIGGTLSVLTNSGSGSFVTAGTYYVGGLPLSVTAADVNGDGKPDIICANGSTLVVMTNNGNGGFALSSTLGGALNGGLQSVIAADVNGDGWVDLIYGNYFSNTVSVFTNDQHGSFALAATLIVGNAPLSITAADVNGDGRLDIICANANLSLSVLVNASTFTPSGSLRVNLAPAGAVSAGAQWQADGGAWQNSGSAAYHLSGGSHIVAFSAVFGWTSPTNQTAFIYTNQITTITGSYVQQLGSLQVNLAPSDAVSAGAQWQVDGGAWQNSGTTVSGVSVGNDVVTFNTITGWTSPVSQLVAINVNQTTTTTGSYVEQFGSLQVDISPAGAVNGGAQWQVDAGAWQDSGATVSGLTLGNHTLSFLMVPGWGTPDSQIITVNFSETTITTAAYLVPSTAKATATMTNGFVVAVALSDTGIGYTNTPLVRIIGGGGSGAQAFAVVSNGVVVSIVVTNAGFGYTNAPVVVIDPPFIPNPVLDIAPMSFLAFSNLTVGGSYQLQRSVAWYWTNQPASFTATDALYTQMVAGVAGGGDYRLALNPTPTQAFATPEVVNGFVVGAIVTSGGSGYVTPPAVSILGGGGTNATALAQISGGVVTNIFITNAGFGYTNTPTLRIGQPPAAALSPAVLPVMRVDSASLAPYDNYQIQFMPALGGTWRDWAGGLFTPTDVTNSQFLFITNDLGFFRLLFVP